MNADLAHSLMKYETDIDGVLARFCGNEKLYLQCLVDFLSDDTLEELKLAISRQEWDNAFTAAHALKGLAGNMGFVPLFHATGELVVVIRAGRLGEIDAGFQTVCHYHDQISNAIRSNLKDAENKGETIQ